MSKRFRFSVLSIAFAVNCGVLARVYAETLWQHNANTHALVGAVLLLVLAAACAAFATSE